MTIYLDHNATTPVAPEVVDAMVEIYQGAFANPASQHREGRHARAQLEWCRDRIREHLGGCSAGHLVERVIFTSGGTESNNLAIRGLCGHTRGRVIVSAIEHPCIMDSAESLRSEGFQVDKLPARADGTVELQALSEALDGNTRLVSIMLANHETGVIQPIREAADLCRAHGVALHTDASQAVGKIPVSLAQLGVTAMTISAHKFHGPKGVGALVTSADAAPRPLFYGGGQQLEARPGTESVALPTGMERALVWSHDHGVDAASRISEMRDHFESILHSRLAEVVVHGANAQRLPNTSCVAFLGVDRQGLLMALDHIGVACSTGSACASGSSEPSPVLVGMGCPTALVNSSLRFSFGPKNTLEEAETAADLVANAVNRLRG